MEGTRMAQVVAPCTSGEAAAASETQQGSFASSTPEHTARDSLAEGLEEVEESPEVFKSLKIGLAPPVAPKLPSLDNLSNDLDVPSEAPFMLQPRPEAVSTEVPTERQPSQCPAAPAPPEAAPLPAPSATLEGVRTLVEQRRVDSALRRLPPGQHGAEGASLRLKCLVFLKKFGEAAQECDTPELKDSFEAQLFLAQLPWWQRADAFSSMLQLQALAERWTSGPDRACDLQLLQVLSQMSLTAGHGHVGLNALTMALEGEADKRQLWSLIGRHHLSWGNVSKAKDAFEEAQGFSGQESTLFLNDGLLAMSQSDYETARGFFEAAARNASDAEEALAAENNLAVCKFYTKDLQGACERLEALVKRDAMRFLKPCLVQNLVSLYEFSQDAAQKRKQLQALAEHALLEDLDPQIFKGPQL